MKRFICLLAIVVSVMFVACAKRTTIDDLVSRMTRAQGGAEALAAIEDQVSVWDSKMMIPEGDSVVAMTGEMIITYQRPNKIKFEVKLPDGTLSFGSVFDGSSGWQYMMGQGVRDMTPAEIQETTAMAETWIDGWHNYSQKGIKLQMLADTTMNNKTYHVVEATDKFGNISTNYCDAQSGLIERLDSEMTDAMTLVKKPSTMTFTEPAAYDGLMMARKVASYDDKGALVFELTLKDAKHNTGIGAEAFAKPMPSAPTGAETAGRIM